MGNVKVRLTGEERRTQIIEAALQVFAQKGFSGSRIKEIAELADISETLIYQHFTTKEELYQVVIRSIFNHPVEPQIAEKMSCKDDEGVFRTIALHLISYSQQDSQIIRLTLFSALDEIHIKDMIQPDKGIEASLQEVLANYVEERINDGALKKMNPSIVAGLFLEAVYMYAIDLHAHVSCPSVCNNKTEVIDTLVDIFLAGIKAGIGKE